MRSTWAGFVKSSRNRLSEGDMGGAGCAGSEGLGACEVEKARDPHSGPTLLALILGVRVLRFHLNDLLLCENCGLEHT